MKITELAQVGVSIWLDDFSRAKLTGNDSHSLPARIAHGGVVGVTTNPSIFNAAISGGSEYAHDIAKMFDKPVDEVVRKLTTDDVRQACDLFSSIFQSTDGVDGRVSIEVDPRLARNIEETIIQGRQLWSIVGRENLMIKVPATKEGLTAITALIADGISVNVTLIFSVKRYGEVLDAFISGIEKCADPARVHSVASFFISRIDSAVDALLKQNGSAQASALLGKAAIASAHLAYQLFEERQVSARWENLKKKGAHIQRPLWASTGVKDLAYDDTRYVVELAAPQSVNTVGQATLDALLDHGIIRGNTITGRYPEALAVLKGLSDLSISLKEVTAQLEVDGVKKFAQSWDELLSNVASVMAQ